MKKSEVLKELSQIITNVWSDQAEVGNAAISVFSERTSYFHGLRTHYQALDWSLLGDDFELSALDWGWKKDNDILVPIMTDISIAPESLTKIIRCKCKVTTKNPCGTMTCSCRIHGIPCLSSCGECRGVDCNNSQVRTFLNNIKCGLI